MSAPAQNAQKKHSAPKMRGVSVCRIIRYVSYDYHLQAVTYKLLICPGHQRGEGCILVRFFYFLHLRSHYGSMSRPLVLTAKGTKKKRRLIKVARASFLTNVILRRMRSCGRVVFRCEEGSVEQSPTLRIPTAKREFRKWHTVSGFTTNATSSSLYAREQLL